MIDGTLTCNRSQIPTCCLTIAHINICSLRNKIHDTHKFLHDHNIHILSVNETWLDCTIPDANVYIPGYDVYRRDRDSRGGGVCLYIHKAIQHKLVRALNTVEGIALTVNMPSVSRQQRTTVAICSVYRPPSSNVVFWSDLKGELEPLIQSNEHIVVLGDFNTNILQPTSHHIGHLTNLTTELCLQNIVHTPTRQVSQSCLDLALLSPSLPPHRVSVPFLSTSLCQAANLSTNERHSQPRLMYTR